MLTQNQTILQVKKEFLVYLEMERNCSKHTIIGYGRELSQFIKFLGADIEVSSITTTLIREWLATLKGYKSITIERKATALKSFFNFCEDQEYCLGNPARKIRLPKRAKRIPVYLTSEEIKKILDTRFSRYRSKPNMQLEVRDRTIIHVLVFCGLRRQELINLKVEDVNLQEGILSIKQGKEAKDRLVPITRDLNKWLRKYLVWRNKTYPDSISDSLFLSYSGNRIDYMALHKMFKRHLKVCGIKKHVTLHTLRHSFSIGLLRRGVDLVTISELLGHENLSSTQHYLQSDIRSKMVAVEKLAQINANQIGY